MENSQEYEQLNNIFGKNSPKILKSLLELSFISQKDDLLNFLKDNNKISDFDILKIISPLQNAFKFHSVGVNSYIVNSYDKELDKLKIIQSNIFEKLSYDNKIIVINCMIDSIAYYASYILLGIVEGFNSEGAIIEKDQNFYQEVLNNTDKVTWENLGYKVIADEIGQDGIYQIQLILSIIFIYMGVMTDFIIKPSQFNVSALKAITGFSFMLENPKLGKIDKLIIHPRTSGKQALKNIVIPIAKRIWELDKSTNVLMPIQVAKIISQKLDGKSISEISIKKWLDEENVIPKIIMEKIKNNNYANTAIEQKARKDLIKKIDIEVFNSSNIDLSTL